MKISGSTKKVNLRTKKYLNRREKRKRLKPKPLPFARLENYPFTDKRVAKLPYSTECNLVSHLARSLVVDGLRERGVLHHTDQIRQYANVLLSCSLEMGIYAIYLTGDNEIIAEERLALGCVNYVNCKPRKIAERALHWGASALVLVHTNPVGNRLSTGSAYKLALDTKLALKGLNITLFHYWFVSRGTHECLLEKHGLPPNRF